MAESSLKGKHVHIPKLSSCTCALVHPISPFFKTRKLVLQSPNSIKFVFFTGETITVVGDHNPALLKYFDCTRSGPRSAFDGNVVYQFEIMEYVRLIPLFLTNQSISSPFFWIISFFISFLEYLNWTL